MHSITTKKVSIFIGIVALIAGLVIMQPGNLFFLNDDFIHLGLTAKTQWLQHNFMRPVCDASMYMDYHLYGFNSVGFHITNILLHAACTVLVFVLSKKIIKKYLPLQTVHVAILIASLFFVYAFHSEGLFWVIGRSGTLGTVMFLPAIIFYVDRNKSIFNFIASCVFFIIGLFTYESIWIMPGICMVLSIFDIKENRATWNKEIKFLLILTVIFAIYLFLKYSITHNLAGYYEAGNFLAINIKQLLINYCKLIARTFIHTGASIFFIAITALTTIAAIISIFKNRSSFFLMLIVIWLISYIPYLSLGANTHDSEGERFLYFPSVIFCILIVTAIMQAGYKTAYKYVVISLLIVSHIFMLANHKNNYALASQTVKQTFNLLNTLPANDSINFYNTPQENKGALIFRYGLTEGVHLFTNKKNSIVNIVSFSNNEQLDSLPVITGENNNIYFK